MDATFNRRSGASDTHGVYTAPHELHNEVRLQLPEGYFGQQPWPDTIHVPDFHVLVGPGEDAGDDADTVKQRTPARQGISAKAVGEAIWHLLCQDFAKHPHVAMSAASGDDRQLTLTGPYLQVMALLMEGWSVEQGGPGIFLTTVVAVSHIPETYRGDDTFVTVIADFHTSR